MPGAGVLSGQPLPRDPRPLGRGCEQILLPIVSWWLAVVIGYSLQTGQISADLHSLPLRREAAMSIILGLSDFVASVRPLMVSSVLKRDPQ